MNRKNEPGAQKSRYYLERLNHDAVYHGCRKYSNQPTTKGFWTDIRILRSAKMLSTAFFLIVSAFLRTCNNGNNKSILIWGWYRAAKSHPTDIAVASHTKIVSHTYTSKK